LGLAVLVRAHRRKFPVSRLAELGKRRRVVERLAVLLRLAVTLRRSRSPDPLPEFRLVGAKRTLDLRFPEGWLDRHPLTRTDLEQEAAYLAAARFSLTFA
jgi:exopolyphosphatase/guanosine-5'-triphosphate,3'-diphosphate pyrophosphatase